MLAKAPGRLLPSELDAEARLVPAPDAREQALLHPALEDEPAAEIDAADARAGRALDGRAHGGLDGLDLERFVAERLAELRPDEAVLR